MEAGNNVPAAETNGLAVDSRSNAFSSLSPPPGCPKWSPQFERAPKLLSPALNLNTTRLDSAD